MGALNRGEVVLEALKQAGRGVEIKDHASGLLNRVLRNLAFSGKFPSLKKPGDLITLGTGSLTAALPTDFGAGMDRLMLGDERTPLEEYSLDDFIDAGGYYGEAVGVNSSRPSFYTIDHEGRLIRFNVPADKAYSLRPIYYKVPADIPVDSGNDGDFPWFQNDQILIDHLVERIYQFTEDVREFEQAKKNKLDLGEYKRNVFPQAGGTQKVRLSPKVFRKPGRW